MSEPVFILEIKLRTRSGGAVEYIIKQLFEVAVNDPHMELSIVRRVVEG